MESSAKIKVAELQNAPKTTLKFIKISIKNASNFEWIFNSFWTHFGTILGVK